MISPSFRKINLQAYKPGRSITKKNDRVIKLSANESALGISDRAKKVLKNFNSNISKYPDGKFVPRGLFVFVSIVLGPYEPKQPPMTLAHITKNFSVSSALPGPKA